MSDSDPALASQTFIEMRWLCASCEAKNLGRSSVCVKCGKHREDEPYFDDPSADTLTAEEVKADAALLAEAIADPDWLCGHCGASQERSADRCTVCGASQERAARVEGSEAIAPPPNLALPSTYLGAEREDEAIPPPPSRPNPVVREVLIGGVVMVTIIVLGVLGYFVFQ